MNRLDPTIDLVFKMLLTREPRLLRDMLEGILGRPVAGLDILDPDICGEQPGDKEIILDIHATLADDSRVDVEMQLQTTQTLASRLVYYGARDYSGQLRRGDDYRSLTPTAVIVWLVDPLFPALERVHSIFELRERHTHALYGEQLTLHVLQLSNLPSPPATTRYHAQVDRWARFLTARSDADFERLTKEHPIMTLAKQALDQLSDDPVTRRLARIREDERKLYQLELAASRVEGKAELLLELLELRFGRQPEAARSRVHAATVPQLRSWSERLLTARTPEECLAP